MIKSSARNLVQKSDWGVFITYDLRSIVIIIVITLLVVGLPENLYITLDPKDSTIEENNFALVVYGFSFKGTFTETATDYTFYPSMWFVNRLGLVMLKTDNEHIADSLIGIIKFVHEKGPNGIIKFVPDN